MLTTGASAQIVGAGDSDGDYRGKPTKGTVSDYSDWSKALGGHLRLEVSMGTLLSAQYTHQLSQYFMVGGGLGWGFRHYVKRVEEKTSPTLQVYLFLPLLRHAQGILEAQE